MPFLALKVEHNKEHQNEMNALKLPRHQKPWVLGLWSMQLPKTQLPAHTYPSHMLSAPAQTSIQLSPSVQPAPWPAILSKGNTANTSSSVLAIYQLLGNQKQGAAIHNQ